MEYARPDALVSTDWLAARLDAPDIRVVDGSFYLPAAKRDPRTEYVNQHIPGAVFFDIDEIADTSSSLPHMDDLSGHDGNWSTDREPGETTRALVKLAGRTLLPMMLAISAAVAESKPLAVYPVEGTQMTSIARPYPANCWLWLKQMFAALPYGERQVLRPLLEEAGFWNALAFRPGEAERVPAFTMSCPPAA